MYAPPASLVTGIAAVVGWSRGKGLPKLAIANHICDSASMDHTPGPTKPPYESKQSPLERNVMVKWVQSPRWDVESHFEKSPIALTYSRIAESVTESKRSFMFLTSKKNWQLVNKVTNKDRKI